MENIEWITLVFADSLLMRTTACTERIYYLQHYNTGGRSLRHPPRVYSDGVAY